MFLLDLLYGSYYWILVLPTCFFFAFPLHFAASRWYCLIFAQCWGFWSESLPAIPPILSRVQLYLFHICLFLEPIVLRWPQDYPSLGLRPSASQRPGTARGLLRCHERSTKSTSWILLVLALPCMSSYCHQVHIESTQLGFILVSKFIIFIGILLWGFCGLVWPFALRRLGVLVAFTELIVFCIGVVLNTVSEIFSRQFLGTHRTLILQWVPGL